MNNVEIKLERDKDYKLNLVTTQYSTSVEPMTSIPDMAQRINRRKLLWGSVTMLGITTVAGGVAAETIVGFDLTSPDSSPIPQDSRPLILTLNTITGVALIFAGVDMVIKSIRRFYIFGEQSKWLKARQHFMESNTPLDELNNQRLST